MPLFRNQPRHRRVTDTEVMAAYGAVLASEIDALRDDFEAERYIRLGADGVLTDELLDLKQRIEDLLPTKDPEQANPPEIEALVDELTPALRARAILATAIELQLPVEFVYTNGDNVTLTRHVSPYELKTTLDGRRFVLGWDHDREGIRQFEVGKAESEVYATEAVSYRQPVSG